MLVIFMSIIALAMTLVFGIGAISFKNNMLQWVDSHWELIRVKNENMSMSEFKYHVSSELQSLGAFSLTLIVSLGIKIVAMCQIIGTRFSN